MTRVTMVGPPESNGGVGRYTSDLSSAFSSDVQCRRFETGNHLRSQLYTFVAAAFDDGDAIHVQYVYQFFGPLGLYSYLLLPILFLLTRLRSKRLVVTMHEVWGEEETGDWFRTLYAGLTHRLLAAVTDSLVFLSERGQRTFQRNGPASNTEIIPHGVHADDTRDIADPRSRFDVDAEEFLVTHHGFVNERKGYDTLLEVAERLPDQQFLVAGGPRGEEFSEYFESVRERAPANVVVTGVLDDESFHAAFRASDLAILPYHDIFQSGIFNWCAAYGTPTMASDIPYFADVAESYGCPELFAEGNTDDAVDTLRRLRSDAARRQQLSERMASYAEENSFAAISSQYDRLYD